MRKKRGRRFIETGRSWQEWREFSGDEVCWGAAILSMLFALRTAMTKECFGLPALLRPDSHEVANYIGNVIEIREPGGHAA
jgi:hypothetical protein